MYRYGDLLQGGNGVRGLCRNFDGKNWKRDFAVNLPQVKNNTRTVRARIAAFWVNPNPCQQPHEQTKLEREKCVCIRNISLPCLNDYY